MYKNLLDKYKFKPNYIWNCDETMNSLADNKYKVVCRANEGKPCEKKVNFDEHITLLLSISASGLITKPLAIFPLKTCPNLSEDVIKNFNIVGQHNGWITGNIFKNFIEFSFIPTIQHNRRKRIG